jgi:hypothetical protein
MIAEEEAQGLRSSGYWQWQRRQQQRIVELLISSSSAPAIENSVSR